MLRQRGQSMPDAERGAVPRPLRLFVALWPGASVRRALATCRDGTVWPAAAAPTPSAKLHLTLHFIGSVPAARVAELGAALQVRAPAFDLCLDLAECWRNGVAVLRPGVVPEPLLRLHADLAEVLRRLGLPVETRAFRPHVTLARRATPGQTVAARPVHWRVSGHALVQSTDDGRYQVLLRCR